MKLKSILLLSSAMLIYASSFGQLHVTTGTKKYVLLEEGTGTWCGYCPDGAEDIERVIEPNYPRAIIASFHNGDGLALSPDDFNTQFISGWPGSTIDRNLFSGVVTQNRPWDSYVATDTGLTAKFEVDMKCTFDSGILKVVVTGKALTAGLTGQWNINAYIIEDSISSSGYPQDNYARPQCTPSCNHYWQFCSTPYDTSWFWNLGDPIVPATKYAHMNVVRAILATGSGGSKIYGDSAFKNPAINATYSKTYTYTVPTGYVSNNMKVIGLVQKFGSSNSDRAIENCIQSKFRLMPKNATGVAQMPGTMKDVVIFPNPAKNFVVVKGVLEQPTDTRIVVYNVTGQVMTDQTFKASGSIFGENISLEGFGNGTYFMNILNNGETITRQFVIQK